MQTLKFGEGSLYVCAKKAMQVDAGSVMVVLKKGAVSSIARHDGLVSVTTLSDARKGSVEVTTAGSAQRIPVEMGQELCVSTNRQTVIDELNQSYLVYGGVRFGAAVVRLVGHLCDNHHLPVGPV